MKKNYTDINVVLDRSGSMESIRLDTIGGFNTFLQSQKEVPGTATFTLCQFDNEYMVVHNAVPIQDVPNLSVDTFVPRNTTALRDAVGRTINSTGVRLSAMPESERPEKVIFLVITDGHENASTEFTAEQIKKMIETQQDVYSWEFVFLGANQDAITAATDYGIHAQNAVSYAATAAGVSHVYRSVANNLTSYRTGAVNDMHFDKDDITYQEELIKNQSQSK